MLKTVKLSLALAALAATPLVALDITAMTAAEREQFRAEIRSYLLENPEVLLEAINVLEQRQAAEAARGDSELIVENAEAIFFDGNSWVGGNPDGDVTMVEFLDYRCGYCRKAFSEVQQLLEQDGNIRMIVKEFPILGPQSELASRFAIATRQIEGDEAYHKVHDALMTFRADISEASLTQLGNDLGFDTQALLAEMDSPRITGIIEENRALAQRLGINGTPSFVFKDQMLRGYVPLGGMQDLIAELRTR